MFFNSSSFGGCLVGADSLPEEGGKNKGRGRCDGGNQGRGGMSMKDRPAFFMEGEILKAGGLGKLLGCGSVTARRIAEGAEGFPKKRIWGRGIEGWSRQEVMEYLSNPERFVAEKELTSSGSVAGPDRAVNPSSAAVR